MTMCYPPPNTHTHGHSRRRSPGAQSGFKTKPNPTAGSGQPACPLGNDRLGDSRPGLALWLGGWAGLRA